MSGVLPNDLRVNSEPHEPDVFAVYAVRSGFVREQTWKWTEGIGAWEGLVVDEDVQAKTLPNPTALGETCCVAMDHEITIRTRSINCRCPASETLHSESIRQLYPRQIISY
jgi:hypothetical protein